VTRLPRDEEELAAQRKEKLEGKDGWRAAIDWVNGPRCTIDWLLVDCEVAGSGEAYDWKNLKVPRVGRGMRLGVFGGVNSLRCIGVYLRCICDDVFGLY
jgi:hypothetical protein